MKQYFKVYVCGILMGLSLLSGCARDSSQQENEENLEIMEEKTTGLAYESAKDGNVDFTILQQENPEIFGWIYIPGTGIDEPLLQSSVSDEFYQTHTADGKEGERGALYIEIPNQTNMCDFNTVIHGKDQKQGDLFYGLHEFENPDYFDEHKLLYLYTPDNVFTYNIYAAYYDEGSDILRRYDYTTYQGCNQYLGDYYGKRDMSMNRRDGWEDLNAGHFLLTLDGTVSNDKQYVVMAALVNAGVAKMDRMIFDGTDYVYDFEEE